jgi:SAM-dependent methyltransferase
MQPCILCGEKRTQLFHKNRLYSYLECPVCMLVFANPEDRLSPGEEKKRYENHQNHPEDPDYRKFMGQLFEPMNIRIQKSSYGLDYGSGPGPTLHLMFEEAGHRMEIFDPFYANNPKVLQTKYDFITCTETAEHFFDPASEFRKLWSLLKPGGILGIMTLLLTKPESFPDWHYSRDDTHVAFYREETFRWLAVFLCAELNIIGKRVILMAKPKPSAYFSAPVAKHV